MLVIGRAGDRIGAQQRLLAVVQAEHDELARTEAEAGRAREREAEQMFVPVMDALDRLDRQCSRFRKRGGSGHAISFLCGRLCAYRSRGLWCGVMRFRATDRSGPPRMRRNSSVHAECSLHFIVRGEVVLPDLNALVGREVQRVARFHVKGGVPVVDIADRLRAEAGGGVAVTGDAGADGLFARLGGPGLRV